MVRRGFTLVELLVVIAIVGMLVALLLPAIQAAREAARRSACQNNLRQVSVAVLLHEDQFGHFPYGGWGHEWVGMSERGYAERQPGGWIFNVLPFLELEQLHDLGGVTTAANVTTRLMTPIAVLTCPTRRPCRLWTVSPLYGYMQTPKPTGEVQEVARGDYAINGGATLANSYEGPPSVEAGDDPAYVWPPMQGPASKPAYTFSGLSHVRTGVRMKSVEDGASCTYLVGEKYLDPSDYENGESPGDNEALVSGYCSDNHRFTAKPPAADGTLVPDVLNHYRFGSAHPTGWSIAMCDGSVRAITYDVDPGAHSSNGHVSDGGLPLP